MSDAVPFGAAEPSAGTLLRQAREASGLHVAALAVNLKVPVRKLEALEADRYEELPDAVFVRALASSVCRTLKIDPQPILERLPQTARPRLIPDSSGINAPFRGPSDGPKPGPLDQLSRPVVLTVVALLLGALVLIFLPAVQRSDFALSSAAPSRGEPVMPPGTPTTITPAPAEPRSAEPAAAASAAARPPVVAAAPAVAPAAAMALKPASATAVPASPAPAVAAATAASTPVAPASAASAALAPAATGIVTFRTRGTSWIQVTDAKGVAVLRKLMEPGESAGASGALPLTVTIGSAESTDVQVRGKPFNLAPVVRDNVARFEVK